MLRELREIASFILGFLPWILLLVLPSRSWDQFRRVVAICLVVAVVLGWKQLRKGFLLQWATVAFFLVSTVSLYELAWVWLAEHMGIIANALLAGIVWFTILVGKPFTIQLAREDTPPERWHDEAFTSACRFIAIFWGLLLLVPTAAAIFRAVYSHALSDHFYLYLSLSCIAVGTVFTSVFKRIKRQQREAMSQAVAPG